MLRRKALQEAGEALRFTDSRGRTQGEVVPRLISKAGILTSPSFSSFPGQWPLRKEVSPSKTQRRIAFFSALEGPGHSALSVPNFAASRGPEGTLNSETPLSLASRKSGRSGPAEARRAASGSGAQRGCTEGAARAPSSGAGGSSSRGTGSVVDAPWAHAQAASSPALGTVLRPRGGACRRLRGYPEPASASAASPASAGKGEWRWRAGAGNQKAGDGSPASASAGALGAHWRCVSWALPSTSLSEHRAGPARQLCPSPFPFPTQSRQRSGREKKVVLGHSPSEMSAQSLLHSVFSCSSPASGGPASAKGFSKRKLRQTRSLDPALIGGCGGEAGAEGGARGATSGRLYSPPPPAQGLGPRSASSPRGPPPRATRPPPPRPLCSSFSTPSTPQEKSPSGSFHFDYEVPLGRSGLKKSMAWDLPSVLAGPGSGRSAASILCSSGGGPNGIFASPRRWLQQRKFQPSPNSRGQPYVVWKLEVGTSAHTLSPRLGAPGTSRGTSLIP
ncbi:PREDICTED: transcription initiation factor TFIID subunit 4-like [Propithecus coquereli]|uniref:transcription initiation factor TFIID subunit 4-like n=1 Tax=Propithecus coquereli TaxID=379532 RepID=UPI00063FBA2F|nr:PREDICTED: transcription initiation factor TFIID subunit 4-like [Propithecus coquereli]